MKKKRLIPFRILPGSWGLSGQTYRRAEAEYYHEGESLDRELAAIEFEGDALIDKLLDIDLKYHRKNAFEVDCLREKASEDATGLKLAELQMKHKIGDPYTGHKLIAKLKTANASDEDKKLALLDVEFAYEKIDESQYEKSKAIIRNEPWIGIVDHGYNANEGVGGLYIEFDWNDQWIAFLRANGYSGMTEDDIVGKWFQDVNTQIASEEYEYNIVADAPLPGNRIVSGNR